MIIFRCQIYLLTTKFFELSRVTERIFRFRKHMMVYVHLCGGNRERSTGIRTNDIHISETDERWTDFFSISISLELSRPVVVHRYDHLPIWTIWAHPWSRTHISDSPFKVLWNCLKLKLCSIIVICQFAPYGLRHCCPFDPFGLSHGYECIYLKPFDVFSPFEVLWNCLDL